MIFSEHKDDYFRVELKGNEISATTEVWATTDANGLNKLFQELGCLEKPWQGKRSWCSMEGDFSIEAVCTSLGNVTLRVTLVRLQGAPEEWRLEAGLTTDFGQLAQIAKQAELFFV